MNKTPSQTAYFDKLKLIRKAYIEKWTGEQRQDPYKFGPWWEIKTEIERNVWNQIRYLGLEFYPQFPISRYYADFANPFKKICIEVDGKIHQEAAVQEKDTRRENYLKNNGWTVYRIPGWKTYRQKENYVTEENELRDQYYTQTAQSVLEAIKDTYFSPVYSNQEEDHNSVWVTHENVVKLLQEHERHMVKQREINKKIFTNEVRKTTH